MQLFPQMYNREKDEMAINNYVKQHKEIKEKVKYIDYENFKIHLNDNCVISFDREFHFRMPGWFGPAAPLIYDNTECYDDSDE